MNEGTRRIVRVKMRRNPVEIVAFCSQCPINRVKVDGKQTSCLYGKQKPDMKPGNTDFIKCDWYQDGSIGYDSSGNRVIICTQQ